MELYSDRVLDVAEVVDGLRKWGRIVDQMSGSGTSVGANVFEADEAMTAKDFAKSMGVALKELSETRFWLRLCARRGWIAPKRLAPLLKETEELKAMIGAMVIRTRRKASTGNRTSKGDASRV